MYMLFVVNNYKDSLASPLFLRCLRAVLVEFPNDRERRYRQGDDGGAFHARRLGHPAAHGE